MNCDASTAFPPTHGSSLCAPFFGLGHITNCSELAAECYTGYISYPGFDTRRIFVGSIQNDTGFEECARRVVGQNGTFERGYIVNEGCKLNVDTSVYNSTGGYESWNAGSSLRGKGTRSGAMLLTYFAIVISLLSAVGMVQAAVPSSSLQHHQRDAALWVARSDQESTREAGRLYLDCRSYKLNNSTQIQTLSPTQRLSDDLDCRNSTTPCAFEKKQYSATFKSTISANGTTTDLDLRQFGILVNYVSTLTDSSTYQTLHVNPGQKGYLAAYVPITYWKTDMIFCADGIDRPVEMRTLKNTRMRLTVVNTN